jgi:hypothetical protein
VYLASMSVKVEPEKQKNCNKIFFIVFEYMYMVERNLSRLVTLNVSTFSMPQLISTVLQY